MPEWYGEFISKLNKGRISPNKSDNANGEVHRDRNKQRSNKPSACIIAPK